MWAKNALLRLKDKVFFFSLLISFEIFTFKHTQNHYTRTHLIQFPFSLTISIYLFDCCVNVNDLVYIFFGLLVCLCHFTIQLSWLLQIDFFLLEFFKCTRFSLFRLLFNISIASFSFSLSPSSVFINQHMRLSSMRNVQAFLFRRETQRFWFVFIYLFLLHSILLFSHFPHFDFLNKRAKVLSRNVAHISIFVMSYSLHSLSSLYLVSFNLVQCLTFLSCYYLKRFENKATNVCSPKKTSDEWNGNKKKKRENQRKIVCQSARAFHLDLYVNFSEDTCFVYLPAVIFSGISFECMLK